MYIKLYKSLSSSSPFWRRRSRS